MKTVQLLALVVFSVSTIFTPQALSQDRPDVLFIAIDDLNDWVGVMGGNNQIRTPNIDELASRGMFFANAHTPGAACLPTRHSHFNWHEPIQQRGLYPAWRLAYQPDL